MHDQNPPLVKASIPITVLESYRDQIGLSVFVNARYSNLLLAQLFLSQQLRELDVYDVVGAIRDVESGDTGVHSKPATPFLREPLRGFMHKHFFQTAYLPRNIRDEWAHNKWLEQELADLFRENEGRYAAEVAGELVHRIVLGAYERRCDDHRRTGEWLIFKVHEDQRYYLTLATHKEADATIYERMRDGCAMDFPFLLATSSP